VIPTMRSAFQSIRSAPAERLARGVEMVAAHARVEKSPPRDDGGKRSPRVGLHSGALAATTTTSRQTPVRSRRHPRVCSAGAAEAVALARYAGHSVACELEPLIPGVSWLRLGGAEANLDLGGHAGLDERSKF
jgi:hypothetical protein